MSRKPDSPVLSSTKFYFVERNAKQLGALAVAVIHMEKRNEKTEKTTKRAEKDMKRTEFAQEYNFNNEKQALRKSDKTGKTEKTNKNCH